MPRILVNDKVKAFRIESASADLPHSAVQFIPRRVVSTGSTGVGVGRIPPTPLTKGGEGGIHASHQLFRPSNRFELSQRHRRKSFSESPASSSTISAAGCIFFTPSTDSPAQCGMASIVPLVTLRIVPPWKR
jgi:hypothetical protein